MVKLMIMGLHMKVQHPFLLKLSVEPLSRVLPADGPSITTCRSPFTVIQSIKSSNITAAISQSQSVALHPNSASGLDSNSNPFFVHFIGGNIRMCQGCKSSLRSIDGGIPKPPFDLAIARFERRPYRDKSGELKLPVQEQAAHYHLKVACVHAVSPYFVPGNLVIPSDIIFSLSATHKEYLRLMFDVSLV